MPSTCQRPCTDSHTLQRLQHTAHPQPYAPYLMLRLVPLLLACLGVPPEMGPGAVAAWHGICTRCWCDQCVDVTDKKQHLSWHLSLLQNDSIQKKLKTMLRYHIRSYQVPAQALNTLAWCPGKLEHKGLGKDTISLNRP